LTTARYKLCIEVLHGSREIGVAARVDPLDLLQPKEVPALDHTHTYDVNGTLWTGNTNTDALELCVLADINAHLRSACAGHLAYEYMNS
jgi:hypothetical protein